MKQHDPKLNVNEAGRTNGDRAQSGRIAVRAYWRTRQDQRESTTQDASDLIADVLHYCHADGGDPLVAHRNGLKDFAQEIELERPEEMPARVLLVVESGLVDRVISNVPVEWAKLDLDTEGSDPDDDDTHDVTDPRWTPEQTWREQKTRAYVASEDAMIDPEAVANGFREVNAALGVPEELQGETARITLPGLTHREIVDHFPILRGMKSGFGTDDDPHFADRLVTPGVFYIASKEHGGGAEMLAAFCCDLIHGERFSGSRYSLANLFHRLDSDHRRAVLAVLEQVAMRGIK